MRRAFIYEYAQALYDIHPGRHAQLERVLSELEKFLRFLKEYPELIGYFNTPLIDAERKRLFLKFVAAQLGLTDDVHGFLWSVAKRQRIFYLEDMMKAYSEMLETKGVKIEATIYSARPLGDKERSLIESRLEHFMKQRVKTKVKVDKKLIGGIRVEADHKIFDSSIRRNLSRLREKMVLGEELI